ncbi:hypothetical protein INR49_016649 [Caranx melampygus]|nr:hypothetical protein INR49_016649 [Caranx melampygus]
MTLGTEKAQASIWLKSCQPEMPAGLEWGAVAGEEILWRLDVGGGLRMISHCESSNWSGVIKHSLVFLPGLLPSMVYSAVLYLSMMREKPVTVMMLACIPPPSMH